LQRDPRRAHCCSCAIKSAASSTLWDVRDSILYIRDVHTRSPELANRGEHEGTLANKTAGHERSSGSANSLQHVAPVAGRVPDRQDDRYVSLPSRGQRLVAPRVPVDRIVDVLPQVRGGFGGETVHVATLPTHGPVVPFVAGNGVAVRRTGGVDAVSAPAARTTAAVIRTWLANHRSPST